MLSLLLKKVTPTPSNFLHELNKKKINTDILKFMLDSKKFSINYTNQNKDSFLHLCIQHNNFKSAAWLIDNGIDVTIKNNDNDDALNLAIKKKNLALVKKILSTKQIDINKKDAKNKTLLQNAILYGAKEIVQYLLEQGIDYTSLDNDNKNALIDAVSYGD